MNLRPASFEPYMTVAVRQPRLFRVASRISRTVAISLLLGMAGVAGLQADAPPADPHAAARAGMVDSIRAMVAATSDYIGKTELDIAVMQAMSKVPRHEFVPRERLPLAYLNRPLPIGHKQTISQPYIVALMTDLARVDKDSVVLEIGTGSGYQAAILAELVRHVYTIEIVELLGRRAADTLTRLGYENISTRIGDGYHGWPEHAPFDAVIVTAAPEAVPQPLIDQLKPGGRLVIPVGAVDRSQTLQVITKTAEGEVLTQDILPVGFVPLTGDH